MFDALFYTNYTLMFNISFSAWHSYDRVQNTTQIWKVYERFGITFHETCRRKVFCQGRGKKVLRLIHILWGITLFAGIILRLNAFELIQNLLLKYINFNFSNNNIITAMQPSNIWLRGRLVKSLHLNILVIYVWTSV